MSLRENAVAAVAAKLVAGGVASGRVYRSRQDALAADELPAVVVEPLSESASEEVLRMLDRTLTVRLSVFGKSTPGDAALDATIAAAEAALLADRTLGLGSDVQVSSSIETSWDFGEQDGVRADVDFQISMRTPL
ncbi:MAG: hypothetical protein ROZ09_15215 [Thiobacillus sp.]|uniref:hypothetical protein n=1 Tax=Thiobacillus sp. TaxID=924 RepID=UPI002893D221|nr:hypothetical protein [Thiobacillus sp.]MDT3708170.1 hypothetical protein [Thiobacillus sp.]